MPRNLRPPWARALEAAPVNERPNALREASAPRRVMALATICLFLPPTPRAAPNATRERPWRRSTARRIDRRSTERPLEPSAALVDAVADRVRHDQRSRLQSAPTQKQSVLKP